MSKKTEEKIDDKKEDNGEEKNFIVLTDEEGKDLKVELLFSIVHPTTHIRYIYVVDPDDEGSVVIMSADDKGNVESVGDNITPELNEFLTDTYQAFESGDLVKVEDGEEGELEDKDEDEDQDNEDKDETKDENIPVHKQGECCCGEECDKNEDGDNCSCSCECGKTDDAKAEIKSKAKAKTASSAHAVKAAKKPK